jgi:hypothetical protein
MDKCVVMVLEANARARAMGTCDELELTWTCFHMGEMLGSATSLVVVCVEQYNAEEPIIFVSRACPLVKNAPFFVQSAINRVLNLFCRCTSCSTSSKLNHVDSITSQSDFVVQPSSLHKFYFRYCDANATGSHSIVAEHHIA